MNKVYKSKNKKEASLKEQLKIMKRLLHLMLRQIIENLKKTDDFLEF